MILVLTDRAARVAGIVRGIEAAGETARVRDDVDLSSMREVRAAVADVKPRAAVLAASWDDLAGCEADEAQAFARNAEPAINLAAATLEFRAVPVLISTAEVFGGTGGPWSEADEPQPVSTFARSRLKGEQFMLRAAPRGLVLRVGPLVEDGLETWQEGLREPIEVADDEMVTPVSASDLGRALVALLEAEAMGVVHVAGPGPAVSRAELWRAVASALGADASRIVGRRGRALVGPAERARNPQLFADRLGKALDAPLEGWRAGLDAAPKLEATTPAPSDPGSTRHPAGLDATDATTESEVRGAPASAPAGEVSVLRPSTSTIDGGTRRGLVAGTDLVALEPGAALALPAPVTLYLLRGKGLLETRRAPDDEDDHVVRAERLVRVPAGVEARLVAVEASEVLVLGAQSET